MVKYNVGDIIFCTVTKEFFRIIDISNNGSIKARGLYSDIFMWSSWNDKTIVPEDCATL